MAQLGHRFSTGLHCLSSRPTSTCRLVVKSKQHSGVENSSDADDDIENSLLGFELRSKADPKYFQKVAKSLNVVWSVSAKKKAKPDQCACCGGSGRGRCSFCRGTGALTLGDTVFCSLQGCKPCPVCKSKGSRKCEHCSGTGFRAAWMEEPNCDLVDTSNDGLEGR